MPKYALNIGADNRVLSVTYDQYGAPGQPRVDALPEDNLMAYDYIDGVLVRNEARAAELAASAAEE